MIKIIYFVHGTSIDNIEKRSSGWNDCSLSVLGIQQCIELTKSIDYSKIDYVFCSDLKRAKETAEILFKKFEIIYDSRLREGNYGILNGTTGRQVKYEEHIETPFCNGESLIDVENRMRSFLNYLKCSFDNKTIAIISHRAPQLALEVITKDMCWEKAISNDWRIVSKWQPGWIYYYGD